VFSGSNKVRYKHVYYIARLVTDVEPFTINPNNKQQCKEIRNIQWFSYEDAQSKIRVYNIERKELLKRLHQVICRMTHKHIF
jgi:NADH pyrophosphatase NudC (nudix superfamily)